MAACTKCGANINPGVTFCGSCGAPVAAAGTAAPAASGSSPSPSATSTGTPMASNVVGLLCYVLCPFTSILFLVIEPYSKDKFVRFHAFQSLFFGIAVFVLSIVLSILSMILAVIPVIGWLIGLLLWLAFPLLLLVAWVYLMVKAYNNEKFKLPIIGNIAEQQAG